MHLLPNPPPPRPANVPACSTRGISTDVQFQDVRVLDSKHVGVQILRQGGFIDKAEFNWNGGLLVGQSSPAVCAVCRKPGQIGCHQKLTLVSYNKESFSPAIGLQSVMFSLSFKPGPEDKAWDEMAYAMVHGKVLVDGVTIANFPGSVPGGCSSYALGNHPGSPDAFHPHSFSRMNVQST